MAVPKKRTSKMKKRQRFANWKSKANLVAINALSKAKMILSQRSNYISQVTNVVDNDN